MRLSHRLPASILLVTLGLAIASSAARANENIRESLGYIANSVQSALKERDIDTVVMGDFTGPPAVGSAAAPGIRKVLSEELAKRGIKTAKRTAPVGVQGRYRLDEYCIVFEITLVDSKGETLSDLNGTNEGVKVVEGKLEIKHYAETAAGAAELIGFTGDLTYQTGAYIHKRPIDSLGLETKKPTATVRREGALAPSSESPFEMEILVDGQPRKIVVEEGLPYIELKLGETFQVRITNKAAFDIGVAFNLDGVNSFAFSDIRQSSGPHAGEPAYTKWVVPSKQSLVLKGWHRTNETVDKFLVTPFGESAAATLGSGSGTGTISATIMATWSSRSKPPAGEPTPKALAGVVQPEKGIGRGGADSQFVTGDKEVRKYGVERAVITVRYDRPAGEKAVSE